MAVLPLLVTFPAILLVPLLTINVFAVIVDTSIVSLKTAVIVVFTATAVALFDGVVEMTVGGTVSASVVKLQL